MTTQATTQASRPTTIAEMMAVETTAYEQAFPYRTAGVMEVKTRCLNKEVVDGDGVSIGRINDHIFSSSESSSKVSPFSGGYDRLPKWFTSIHSSTVGERAEEILGSLWDELQLDLLSTETLHPMIAGGRVEGTVQRAVYEVELTQGQGKKEEEEVASLGLEWYLVGRNLQRDVDVFLSFTEDHSDEAIQKIIEWCGALSRTEKYHHFLSLGPSGVTLVHSFGEEEERRSFQVQLIPVCNRTLNDVINSFDLDCCCAYFVKGQKQLSPSEQKSPTEKEREGLMVLPRAVEAWRKAANIFRPSRITSRFESRVVKYFVRGYDLIIPTEYQFDWRSMTNLSEPVKHGSVQDLILFRFDPPAPEYAATYKYGKDLVGEPRDGEYGGSYLEREPTDLSCWAGYYLWKKMVDHALRGKSYPYSYISTEGMADSDLLAFYHGTYTDKLLHSIVSPTKLAPKSAPYLVKKWGLGSEGERWIQMGRELEAISREHGVSAMKKYHHIQSVDELVKELPPISDRHDHLRSHQQNTNWFCRA